MTNEEYAQLRTRYHELFNAIGIDVDKKDIGHKVNVLVKELSEKVLEQSGEKLNSLTAKVGHVLTENTKAKEMVQELRQEVSGIKNDEALNRTRDALQRMERDTLKKMRAEVTDIFENLPPDNIAPRAINFAKALAEMGVDVSQMDRTCAAYITALGYLQYQAGGQKETGARKTNRRLYGDDMVYPV